MSDQLLDLQRRWTTRLAALLDRTLEDDPMADLSLADSVAATWRRLAGEQPQVRAYLDGANDPSPALLAAMEHEYWTLAVAAGLADLADPHEHTARIGRAYLTLLRGDRSAQVSKSA